MNRDELQGRWILTQGWLGPAQVGEAFRAAQSQAGADLCGILLARGLLNNGQAEQARAGAARALIQDRAPSGEIETLLIRRPRPAAEPASSFASAEAPTHKLDYEALSRKAQEARRAQSAELPATVSSAPAAPAAALSLEHSLDRPRAFEIKEGAAFRDYLLDAELSRGAMGVIFRARRQGEARPLALKFMLGDSDERFILRFQQEAEALIRLSHPHIVEISDFGVEEGQPFIAMELIEGRDLKSLIKESLRLQGSVPPWQESLRGLEGIASALAYCHERSILHRDIKPSNILIEEKTARAVLVDFGLMKKGGSGGAGSSTGGAGSSSGGLTKTGEIIGTPAFMAPEQFAPGGEFGDVGPAADVWGFGATLFFALTGRPPFDRTTMVEIFQAISTSPVPRLHASNPEVPPWLDELCADCLEKQSTERPTILEVRLRIQEMSATRSARPGLLKALLAGLVACAGTAAVLLLWARPAVLDFVALDGDSGATRIVTSRDQVQVSGRASRAGAIVRVHTRGLRTDAEGAFSSFIGLPQEGENVIFVRIEGNEDATLRRLVAVRDQAAPAAEFTTPKDEAGCLLPGAALRIEGRARDPHGAEVRFGGQAITATGDGSFSFSVLDLETVQDLKVELRDSLGNTREESMLVLTPAAAAKKEEAERAARVGSESQSQTAAELESLRKRTTEAFERFLARLKPNAQEREALRPLSAAWIWRLSSDEAQDGAIEAVHRRLDQAFVGAYEAMATQRVLGDRLRLATFQHRRTRISLNLIPGGFLKVRWWSRPQLEEFVAALEVLAGNRSNPEMLEELLGAEQRQGISRRVAAFYELDSAATPETIMNAVRSKPERFPGLRGSLRAAAEDLAAKFSMVAEEYIGPFLIGCTEVSRREYAFGGGTLDPGLNKAPELPITTPSPATFEAWLLRLAQDAPTEPALRLPNRLEWLHACLAGTSSGQPLWGLSEERLGELIWSQGMARGALRATSEHRLADRTNPFGLADLLGNAREPATDVFDLWIERWAKHTPSAPKLEPPPAHTRLRAILGGDCETPLELLVPDIFRTQGLGQPAPFLGLRVVCSVP